MRRRVRRMGRRGPRRKTDWIPCITGTSPTNPVTDNVATTIFDAWIDTFDMTAHTEQLTVVRMVGEVYFGFQRAQEILPVGAILVSWGFYVSALDDSGATIVLDPGSDASSDSEDWMFRRTVEVVPFSPATLGAAVFNSWDSAHFDTRVMRKMEGRKTLNFIAKIDFVQGVVTPVTCEMYGNVRALVKCV